MRKLSVRTRAQSKLGLIEMESPEPQRAGAKGSSRRADARTVTWRGDSTDRPSTADAARMGYCRKGSARHIQSLTQSDGLRPRMIRKPTPAPPGFFRHESSDPFVLEVDVTTKESLIREPTPSRLGPLGSTKDLAGGEDLRNVYLKDWLRNSLGTMRYSPGWSSSRQPFALDRAVPGEGYGEREKKVKVRIVQCAGFTVGPSEYGAKLHIVDAECD